LQIKTPGNHGASNIHAIGNNDDDQIAAVQPSLMSTLVQLMQQLTKKVEELRVERPSSVKSKPQERGTGCWGCGQEGHTRRACKTNPWPTKLATTGQQTGNAYSPQQ
jgi:hypothetical protein